MPDIYLLIEGQQQGPYAEEQVRQSLADGQIPGDLPAWDGIASDWVPLETLLGSPQKLPPLPQPNVQERLQETVSTTAYSPSSQPTIPTSVHVPSSEQWKKYLTFPYLGIGLAILAALLTCLFYFQTTGDIFKVFAPATEPSGAWQGCLYRSDGTTTLVIIDFGSEVTIAEDDKIIGTFIPTSETGTWNGSQYRIYKVQGKWTFVHPAQ